MKNKKRKEIMGYLFLVPAIILIAVFVIYPVLNTLYLSFFSLRIQTLSQGAKFVGLNNFKKILGDKQFMTSLVFTLKFTVIAVFLETIVGFFFASIMNKSSKIQGLIRTAILIPWAIPTIISGLMWQFMYSPQYGIINHVLIQFSLVKEAIPWLSEASWAMVAVIVADVWKTTPYMSLLILAGLQTVPSHLTDAAAIDGAGKAESFFYITLPIIKPVLMVAVLFRVLATFRIYDLIVVLTNGGPANQTSSLSLYTINTYFNFGNIGYGSALATVTFIISLLISMLFLNVLKTKIQEAE